MQCFSAEMLYRKMSSGQMFAWCWYTLPSSVTLLYYRLTHHRTQVLEIKRNSTPPRLKHLAKLQCFDESLFPAGRDFSHDETLDVPTQVELLIKQATSHENLCQCYIGWSVLLLELSLLHDVYTSDVFSR